MPPKKKTATGTKRKAGTDNNAGIPSRMWLLTLKVEYRGDTSALHQSLFSSKEKAVAAAPALLDSHCPHGTDWRNGLDGFGREDEDNYLGYEHNSDGVIISNSMGVEENGGDLVEAKVQQLVVDPIVE